MNPAAPVTNAVARVVVGMAPVCGANAVAPTDDARTELVRFPYGDGSKISRHET
jgi:hypothetical protein